MLTDQLTEEQITDIQEVQDSLIIPLRQLPATATCLNTCTCAKRHLMIPPDEPGGMFKTDEIAQFAGKVSTKIRR